MMNSFWWKSNSTSSKGIRWLAWERMSMSKKGGGLGFRDLHGFNLALLGKQCWNLVNNPNSLVAKVLKARYFPNCSLLQATRGGGSSYTWSGIWEAKEKLKDGFRWVLGDGKTIDIFNDRWLRGKENWCVNPQEGSALNSGMKVCDFFLQNKKEWDVDKVRNTFDLQDENAIVSTRIPQNCTSDRLAWVHSNDGQYTVKTGYKKWHQSFVGSMDVQQSNGWGRLWRLKIPHKVKYLLWRICRNTIPVRYRLRGKGVVVPIGCFMCTGDVEHLMHLFIDCTYATECWQRMGMVLNTWEIENASEWLLDKLNMESQENLVTIATVIWGIWFARNQKLWENKVLTPAVALAWSSRQIVEWVEANKNRKKGGLQSAIEGEHHRKKWTPPENGSVKMNVDASVYPGADSFSVGMVLRDCKGQFLRGKVMKLPGCVPVEEAEMTAIYEALVWSKEFPDQQQITVESDSLICVNAINKAKKNYLEMGDLTEQCREVCRTRNGISVVFTKKQANRVAHRMARLPCTPNGFSIFSSPPLILLETLMSDVLTV